MALLFDYFFRLMPGLVLVIAAYLLVPKDKSVLKIFILIFGFILMRDTMTPLKLWEFGVNGNVLWLRFIDDAFILIAIGILSLAVTVIIYRSNQPLASQILWFKSKNKMQAIVVGILAALVIAIPFMLPYIFIPIEDRGGTVALNLLLPLLVLALLGNLLEEVLFRGFLQNYLRTEVGIIRSIVLSALFFAIGHTFLATTVTDLGVWVLVFTLYEGLVCAYISEKYGLISATFAHGLAIFMLASGVV